MDNLTRSFATDKPLCNCGCGEFLGPFDPDAEDFDWDAPDLDLTSPEFLAYLEDVANAEMDAAYYGIDAVDPADRAWMDRVTREEEESRAGQSNGYCAILDDPGASEWYERDVVEF